MDGEFKKVRRIHDDRLVGGVNERGRVVDMEGRELVASSKVPPHYSTEEWKALTKTMREIESSSYLARLKAEAKEKLKKKRRTDRPIQTRRWRQLVLRVQVLPYLR